MFWARTSWGAAVPAAIAATLVAVTATPGEARDINLTGSVLGGSRICSSGGCSRTEDNRETSVFVVRTKGEVARVRQRGRVYSADIDRVVVRLSDCSLKLRAYLGGATCARR